MARVDANLALFMLLGILAAFIISLARFTFPLTCFNVLDLFDLLLLVDDTLGSPVAVDNVLLSRTFGSVVSVTLLPEFL